MPGASTKMTFYSPPLSHPRGPGADTLSPRPFVPRLQECTFMLLPVFSIGGSE